MKKVSIEATVLPVVILLILTMGGCGGGGSGSTEYTVKTSIDQLNEEIKANGGEWVAGETKIYKLSAKEFKILLGAVPQEPQLGGRMESRMVYQEQNLPLSLNWANKDGINWLTPAKDQGSCGSCVGYSSVAVVESLAKIASNNPNLSLDLSEPYLYSCIGGRGCSPTYPDYDDCESVDSRFDLTTMRCMKKNGGGLCASYPYQYQGSTNYWVKEFTDYRGNKYKDDNYGWAINTAAEALKNNGVFYHECLEWGEKTYTVYPNEGNGFYNEKSLDDPSCSNKCTNWSSQLVKIKSYQFIYDSDPIKTRSMIKAALQNGPVLTDFEVFSDFNGYCYGVYKRNPSATSRGWHAVAIVGYNDEKQYWIVKNSWGDDWGEPSTGKDCIYSDRVRCCDDSYLNSKGRGFFRIKYGEVSFGEYAISMQIDEIPPSNP